MEKCLRRNYFRFVLGRSRTFLNDASKSLNWSVLLPTACDEGRHPMLRSTLAIAALALFAGGATAEKPPAIPHDPAWEVIPDGEATQIDNVVKLTLAQMQKLYLNKLPPLRGVHPKDHGCVLAKFQVLNDLPEAYRIGVFAKPGREYQAYIRYSNADILVRADSKPTEHGSRGMAIKLLKVEGERLVPKDEPMTQDFLMVNHPVFAFANVEDYEVLSQVLLEEDDKAAGFFKRRIKIKNGAPNLTDPTTLRAVQTSRIIKRIQSLAVDPVKAENGAYQPPPASPEENVYQSGAPYLLGKDFAMKYSVKPVACQSVAAPNITDKDYLRTALAKRLTDAGAKDIVLEFQLQIRSKTDIGNLETEIENACTEWKDKPVTVARITIPPQDFNTKEAMLRCENLFFTPWHSLKEHQPIGGINRMKLKVYEASSMFRHLAKEPSGY